MAIVRVKKHKTGKESGPAAVTLKRPQHVVFERFCAVRMRAFPKEAEEARLLVSVQGSAVRNDNLLKPLERIISKADEKPSTIQFNWIRKTIETCSVELLDGTAAEDASSASSGIMRYLCHSSQVTKLHYRFRTDKVILRQYRQVESGRGTETAPPLPSRTMAW